jgi:hypothetical protein
MCAYGNDWRRCDLCTYRNWGHITLIQNIGHDEPETRPEQENLANRGHHVTALPRKKENNLRNK